MNEVEYYSVNPSLKQNSIRKFILNNDKLITIHSMVLFLCPGSDVVIDDWFIRFTDLSINDDPGMM